MADRLFAAITKNRTNPAYSGARLGLDRMLGARGVEVRHFVPETPDDIDQQRVLIREAIALKPDAIMLAPAHATRLNDAVDEIAAAGIPMVCFVSQPDPSPAVTFVGSDDLAIGHAMARRMVEHLGGRGAVAVVDGHPNAATAGPRGAGFRAELAEHEGVTLVGACRGDYQRDVAYDAFTALLPSLDRLDGVIVANDYMALGVRDALVEAGRTGVPMIGANVTPAGVEMIKDGRLIASAAFDALSMGAIAAEAALRHLAGETVPAQIELPAQLVDRDNLGAWDRPYEEREAVGWNEAVQAATRQT